MKQKFNQGIVNYKSYKEYFIQFADGKLLIIKSLNERSMLKGQNILYELITYDNF